MLLYTPTPSAHALRKDSEFEVIVENSIRWNTDENNF